MAEDADTHAAHAGAGEEGPPDWWASEDYYRLLSVPFHVRSEVREFSDALRWHLAPFHSPRPLHLPIPIPVEIRFQEQHVSGVPIYAYYSNNTLGATGLLSRVLSHALWDIHATAPRIAPDFLFVHAGSVARDGGVLLLPAPRDSGKSTLVAALLDTGFAYLSDELGALDPVTKRAYAFPKRISLDHASLRFLPGLEERLQDRQGLSKDLPERYVRPEDVGAGVGEPAAVRWIVFPTMDREGRPRLDPMARSLAVERLAENCFNLYRYSERGVILFSLVVGGAQVYTLSGGTPSDRAALLADRLS